MVACHLLLGRPWQYDRKIVYDGVKNTFLLEKNGKHILMTPLKEGKGEDSTSNHCFERRIMFCSAKTFLKEERKVNCCFVVIPKCLSLDENRIDIPIEVEGMLSEFKEIISKEMLKGLPPVRSISHQIDLIPGSSLPNKALHRMILVENEELNR